MTRRTVLFVCHNHPSVRPGGAENYAYELFESFAGSDEFSPLFLAKGGRPLGRSGRSHEGTYIAPVGDRPDDYFFYTDGYEYDWLFGTLTDKDYYSTHFRKVLESMRPDVVHFQHLMFLGYDAIRLVRNVLPDAAIVLTLHEYLPMCHRQGQLLRTFDNQPCAGPSPRRCHECFPDIAPQQFFLRRQFIQSHLSLVDRFVAPSAFLAEQYVRWGISKDKIVVEENGRSFHEEPAIVEPRPHRDRFAFFGQISPYKGVDVLLEAMHVVAPPPTYERSLVELMTPRRRSTDVDTTFPRPRLTVHGANLELQEPAFQDRIAELATQTSTSVTMAGRYDWRRLGELMRSVDWVVLPSIWFENSPLVIQEAFYHGRPVLCSDIGGMAEKVRHERDGLHFRAGDADDLAAVIRRAASTPGLWDRLREGIEPVHSVVEHRERLSQLYAQLLETPRRPTGSPVRVTGRELTHAG